MKLSITLQNEKIKISEPQINDVYFIEQDDNQRFYITSVNGYNGYEGAGHKSLEQSLSHVKKLVKDHFLNRCEENPKGW